jgi:hypothetical protein
VSKHAINPSTHTARKARTVVAASFGVGALAIAGAGVYAGLNAVTNGTQAVSSGTLKLVNVAGTGSGGFGLTYSDLAPGDAQNTYVDVTDTGTIAARNLVLGVTGTGATALTTDATRGLHITLQSCALPWVAGVCASPTTVINNAAVTTLAATPASVVSGAVTKNSAYHYKITTTLPDSSETTTNGTLPGSTIQNLSTTLTFTFDEAQRAATTTEN